MALRLFWSDPAKENLRRILDYIAAEDEGAAARLRGRIDAMIVPTLEHPYLFRPGRLPGTREIVVHPNYIVVYKVAAEHIEVVRVLHTRRKYP
jgi:toxin ParE1/3/4